MNKKLHNFLKKLQVTTDGICALNRAEPIKDAYNAADLRCVDAEYWENADGDNGFRVWISEAAPEAVNLRAHISKRLKNEFGYKKVEVVTEW